MQVTFPDDSTAQPGSLSTQDVYANADVVAKDYPLLDAHGNRSDDIVTGMSLRAVLAQIGDSSVTKSITYVLVTRDDGSHVELTAADLQDPSDFTNGLQPAVAPSGQGPDSEMEFIRPQRSAGDVNFGDHFQTGPGGTVQVQVHTRGQLIDVATPEVGQPAPQQGTPVSFTTSAPQAGPGGSYSWSFGDGATRSTTTPTTSHRFRAGQWPVRVSVTDDAGDFGESAAVSVTVGKPITSATSSTPGGRPTRPAQASTSPASNGPPTTTGPSRPGPDGVSATPSDSASGQAAGPTPSAGFPSRPNPSAPTTSASPSPTPPAGPGRLIRGLVVADAAQARRLAAAPVSTSPAGARQNPTSQQAATVRPDAFDARWLWWLLLPALLAVGVLGERRRPRRAHPSQSGRDRDAR